MGVGIDKKRSMEAYFDSSVRSSRSSASWRSSARSSSSGSNCGQGDSASVCFDFEIAFDFLLSSKATITVDDSVTKATTIYAATATTWAKHANNIRNNTIMTTIIATATRDIAFRDAQIRRWMPVRAKTTDVKSNESLPNQLTVFVVRRVRLRSTFVGGVEHSTWQHRRHPHARVTAPTTPTTIIAQLTNTDAPSSWAMDRADGMKSPIVRAPELAHSDRYVMTCRRRDRVRIYRAYVRFIF